MYVLMLHSRVIPLGCLALMFWLFGFLTWSGVGQGFDRAGKWVEEAVFFIFFHQIGEA